jgi:hypothetical protein
MANPAKGTSSLSQLNVDELSLTGNEAYSDMLAKKVHW